MRNRKWKVTAAAGIAVVAAGAVAGFSGIAGADPTANASKTYVDGLDAVTDDFNDHSRELGAPLSYQGENSWGTDTVMLWQSILAADQYLDLDSVDGYFGEKTKQATAQWQADRGIDADEAGTVGHTTWATADNNLVDEDDTIYYETVEGGGVLLSRAGAPDDGYKLLEVSDADGRTLTNSNDAEHIEHYELTIKLAPAE